MSNHGGRRVNSGRKAKNPELLEDQRKSVVEMERRIASTPKYENFPKMPDGMLEEEIVIWDEVMEEYVGFYEATGIMPINSLDTKSLRNYCMYSAILESLREELKKNYKAFVKKQTTTISTTNEGKKRRGQSTQEKVNPVFAEIIKIETRQSTLAMQLNLTPDARNRMGLAIAKKKEDALGKFLEGMDE